MRLSVPKDSQTFPKIPKSPEWGSFGETHSMVSQTFPLFFLKGTLKRERLKLSEKKSTKKGQTFPNVPKTRFEERGEKR